MSSASSSHTAGAEPATPPPPCVGPWRLERRVGAGSFGQVFTARHRATGERAAVKRCRRDAPETAAEVTALRALRGHPNIVRLLDVVHLRESTYIVEELVDGPDLFDHVQNSGGCLPAGEAREITHQLLSALRFAHSRGLLHRDIKLENAVVCPDGTVKLVDFGLAVPFDRSSRFAGASGSVRYSAPTVLESAVRGVPYPADGGFVDTYSVGVVAYAMLSGAWPYRSPTADGLFAEVMASYKPSPSGAAFFLPFPAGSYVDPLAKHFVRHLMDCRVRCSAEAALRHPWLAEGPVCEPARGEAQGVVLRKDASAGAEGLPKLAARRGRGSPKAWFGKVFAGAWQQTDERDAKPDQTLVMDVPPVPPPKPAAIPALLVGA
ncbi:kinase-like domain-containing protein [Hyaloraphidium curvatum]|nr:kinase-like domain-containing protein [Hyaloraphidium curvatum]